MPETSTLSRHYRQLYAWYGAAFGVVFPVIALLLRFLQFGVSKMWRAVESDPLLWIIMTAPLFLGLFAWLGGIQRDKTEDILRELTATNEQLTGANQEIQRQIFLVEEQSRDIEIINTQLHDVNAELTEANDFKVRMLGIASHDLKSPLTNILLQAEFLRRKPHETSSVVERADDIYVSGEQMRQIIDELLDTTALYLGKIQLRYAPCDLAQLVHTSIEAYKEVFEEKNQTVIAKTPQSLIIQGDEARLRQIADNLLSNAMKYSPESGQITVIVREHLKKHSNTPRVVELCVIDSGQGFTDEDKTRLFGMFQRLSAQPTGGESSSGVGLASVKHLVELHGGTITLESSPGQGSTFIVRLPQAETTGTDGNAGVIHL